jgi:RNA polymerase sigma-70 factor (ECF subfamily)
VERKNSQDFTALYDAHVGRVYGFFAYRLGRREESEDLCQLTFERALRAWSRYDPERSAPTTWLFAIASNLLIDHYRRRRPGSERSIDDVQEASLPSTDLVAPGLGLDAGLEAALASLTPRSRGVIALRYGADLTGPEIATISGLTLTNVQQILSRALRQMREVLGAAQGTGSGPAQPGAG